MAWIESHTVLIRHKKLISMAKELRLKPVYLMGHLHALWHTVLEQQEDGDLSSWSDDLIAEYSHFTGDCSQFVSLLRKYRWLDGNFLHDWMDYAGRYLESKYRTSDPDRLNAIREKHKNNQFNYVSNYSHQKCVDSANESANSANDVTNYSHVKSDFSQTLVSPPNLTLPNQPNQQKTIAHPQKDWFNAVWEEYPRKLGRNAALRHFNASVKTENDYQEIKIALAHYNEHVKTKVTDSKFIQHGSTWFNNWRDWVDYQETKTQKEIDDESMCRIFRK